MSNGPGRNMRGAGNPGSQPVMFTLQDAERIGRAVGQIETGRRGRIGSTLPRAAGSGGVAVCGFTGAWGVNQVKTVFISSDTGAPMEATNLFFPNIAHASAMRTCVVAGGILISTGC